MHDRAEATMTEHASGGNRPGDELDDRQYLRAGEAARLLHVSAKTMSRWAKEGRVPCIVTLGGHRRFPRQEIEELARKMMGGESPG